MRGLAEKLTERVTLIVRDGDRDTLGGADGVWRDAATVWAIVTPRRPGEDDAGAAPRWLVTIRSGRGVRPGWRLRWGTITMRVRMTTYDPATPDRLLMETEAVR